MRSTSRTHLQGKSAYPKYWTDIIIEMYLLRNIKLKLNNILQKHY